MLFIESASEGESKSIFKSWHTVSLGKKADMISFWLYCTYAQTLVSVCLMFQNRWDHLWVILLPTLPLLYFVAWLNTISLLLRELFTAINSSQLTRHITALLKEKGLLLFCLPFSHLRLFIQELKVKVYLCHSQYSSTVLSVYLELPSIILPFYFMIFQPELQRVKIHDICDVSWKSRSRAAQNSQSVYQCAWVMLLPQLERLKHSQKE